MTGWIDPIVSDVRAIREAFDAKFDFDPQKIGEAYMRMQAQDAKAGQRIVDLVNGERVDVTGQVRKRDR